MTRALIYLGVTVSSVTLITTDGSMKSTVGIIGAALAAQMMGRALERAEREGA